MYLSPQILLNVNRGRLGSYRATEYSATIDDTIGLFKGVMQFKLYMTSFNDHDSPENWLKNVIDLCNVLCKHSLPTATMEIHCILP
jgi:hypothetical protein